MPKKGHGFEFDGSDLHDLRIISGDFLQDVIQACRELEICIAESSNLSS